MIGHIEILNSSMNSMKAHLPMMSITILRTAAGFHPTNLLPEREIRNKLKEIILH